MKAWEILKAIDEGKKVQAKHIRDGKWSDLNISLIPGNTVGFFMDEDLEWRIKPEPREWYEVVRVDGTVASSNYWNKDAAHTFCKECNANPGAHYILNKPYRVITFREVLDEQ